MGQKTSDMGDYSLAAPNIATDLLCIDRPGGVSYGAELDFIAGLFQAVHQTAFDARYEPIDSAYTKAEADARYEPLDSAYTKAEADARYEPINTMYTKAEADAKYFILAAPPATLTVNQIGAVYGQDFDIMGYDDDPFPVITLRTGTPILDVNVAQVNFNSQVNFLSSTSFSQNIGAKYFTMATGIIIITSPNTIMQTWNAGTQAFVASSIAITNTASAFASYVALWTVSGVGTVFSVLKSGDTRIGGFIQTGIPAGGAVATWKLGARVAAAVALDITQYIQVDVNGAIYKLGIVV